MKPIKFDGHNIVIAENQPPYMPLPALCFGDPLGTLLFCWDVSDEELELISRTRKVWVTSLSFNQPLQPLCLSADRPQLPMELEVAPPPPDPGPSNWFVVHNEMTGDKVLYDNLTRGVAEAHYAALISKYGHHYSVTQSPPPGYAGTPA